VSILTNDPKGGGHPLGWNIFGAVAGYDLCGKSFALENLSNRRVKVCWGGFGLIDREEEGATWGEKGQTGKKKRFEFPVNPKRTAPSPVSKSGGVEDDGIKRLAPTG
jgi:hypothetical protein